MDPQTAQPINAEIPPNIPPAENTPPYSPKPKQNRSLIVGIIVVIIVIALVIFLKFKPKNDVAEPSPIAPVGSEPGGDQQVGDVETYVDISTCDELSTKVINEKNLPIESIHSCQITPVTVNFEAVNLVSVSYGPAMDCPSGCIYSAYKGVILSDNQTVIDLPSSGPNGLLAQIWAQPPLDTARNNAGFQCPSDLENYTRVSLAKMGEVWGWKLDYTSPLNCTWEEYDNTTQAVLTKSLNLSGSMFVFLDAESEAWNTDGLIVK